MVSQAEIERRYKNTRAAMEQEKLDAFLVCGYDGRSGHPVVHRFERQHEPRHP